MFKHKKGQSTLEYALLIAVVATALIAMQAYINRASQGYLKTYGDRISLLQYDAETDTLTIPAYQDQNETWHATETPVVNGTVQ